MKLTKNFSLSEFNCHCNKCSMSREVQSNIESLAVQLQLLRDYVGEPIKINSAYRCESHNKSVGGSKRSQHLLGKAADITINTFSPDEVVDIVENLLINPYLSGFNIGGVGKYKTFTHIDIRKTKARW